MRGVRTRPDLDERLHARWRLVSGGQAVPQLHNATALLPEAKVYHVTGPGSNIATAYLDLVALLAALTPSRPARLVAKSMPAKKSRRNTCVSRRLEPLGRSQRPKSTRWTRIHDVQLRKVTVYGRATAE